MARGNKTQNPNNNQQRPQIKQSEAVIAASEKYAKSQQDILNTEKQIADLMGRTARTVAESYEITEKIKRLEEARKKFKQDLLSIESEISSILDEQENTEKNIVDIIKKNRQNQSEIKDLTNSVLNSMREQKHQMVEINDVGKQVTENMNATRGFSESFGNILEVVNNKLAQNVSFSDQFMDALEETNKIREEYRNLEREIADGAKESAEGKYDAKKVEEDLVKKMSKLHSDEEAYQDKVKDFLEKKKDMTEEQIKAKKIELSLEREALKSREISLNAMSEQNKVLGESSKIAEKTIGVLDKITSGDFKGALLQKFGLDEINSQIKGKVGGALVNVVKSVKSGDLKGAFSAAGSGLKDMIGMAGKLTAALGIGALFMLGKFLIDSFGKLDEEVSKLGKEFGVSKNEAKELHHAAVDVANEMKVTGIHSEEIAKSLKTVSDNLGGIDLTGAFASGNAQVQQMVKDTTLLTEKFGLSAEEAGNLSNIAAISGKSVGEMSMMASTLGKGIFSAKESMKILAGIPKSIVSSMSKMPEAMIKTAMHAKMLGMDMKQIADIGRKSLDIEQSLESEMEARVLLGREINLDKMRAAALDGDQETVMKELLNAAGSMDDFNKMNVIQKEALAKAAGMEVDQLAEMLGKQEELNKAGLSQSKIEELQQKNATELASIAANTNDANKKAYLEKLAAEKKSEETQAAMADLMKRLQELAVKLVTPILDVVDGLLQGKDGANAMDGIFNVVSKTVKTIVPIIKFIAEGIGMIIKPLTWILGLFSSTEDQTEAIAKTTGTVSDGIAGVTDKVKPLTAGFGNVLGIVTAIGGFFAGKALLGKGLDVLKGKVGDLGSTLVSKVGGPLGKIGGKLFGGGKKEESGSIGGDKADVGEAEKGKNMVSGIFDKIKSIIDSIKGVVQSAIGFVRDVGKDLLATFKDLIAGIGNILREGANIIVDVGTKLADGAMKILNIIMNGLASAAEKLPKIMGALGKAVVAFFEPMSSLVNPMIIGGILIFTGAMIGLSYAFKLLGEGIGAAAPGITAFFDGVGGVIKTVGEAIAKVIETITTSVIRLQDIDGGKMTKAALGIYAIAGALAAFGGGSFIAGLGAALGKLFDEDPVDKFNRFATIDAKSLDSVAKAILTLAQAMQTFSNISSGLNLDKVDQMVESIEKLKDAQTSASISDLGTKVVGGLTSFVGNIFGSSEKQTTQPVGAGGGSVAVSTGGGGTNMANVEKKLDTLISVISQAANQPLVIKFGEKTVEEIKSQLNFKAATSIGVNNKTYAKTI
jgi:hypothetical protein